MSINAYEIEMVWNFSNFFYLFHGQLAFSQYLHRVCTLYILMYTYSLILSPRNEFHSIFSKKQNNSKKKKKYRNILTIYNIHERKHNNEFDMFWIGMRNSFTGTQLILYWFFAHSYWFLLIRHSPEDTGESVWRSTYSGYNRKFNSARESLHSK